LVRFHYYSDNMADIIPNQEVLEAIDRILVDSKST